MFCFSRNCVFFSCLQLKIICMFIKMTNRLRFYIKQWWKGKIIFFFFFSITLSFSFWKSHWNNILKAALTTDDVQRPLDAHQASLLNRTSAPSPHEHALLSPALIIVASSSRGSWVCVFTPQCSQRMEGVECVLFFGCEGVAEVQRETRRAAPTFNIHTTRSLLGCGPPGSTHTQDTDAGCELSV